MYAIDADGAPAARVKREEGEREERPASALALSPAWILGALLRSKKWILVGGVLGALVALALSAVIPPRYVSTAQILIDPRDLRVFQNEVTPGGILNDSTTAYLETQARVIDSDRVKMRVIENEGLESDPEFSGGRVSPLAALLRDLGLGSEGKAKGDPAIVALEALNKKVTVRRGERTFVIDIAVTTEDPNKSARIANALATAYFKDQSAVRSDSTQRASNALSGRLFELRDRAREADEKVQAFKALHDIAGPSGKLVTEEQLNLGGTSLSAARMRTAEARAKYEQLKNIRPAMLERGALPEAVVSNTVTALRAQLGAALARESDLVTQLGPSHPQMISARAQVQDARRQIGEELKRIVDAARVDYERATSTEKEVTRRFADLKKDSFDAGQASVQLRELEREAEASRAVYQAFLLRAREASELVGVDSTNARVISDALPPTNRSNIAKRFIILAGLIGGMGLGGLLGLGLQWGRREEEADAGIAPNRKPGPSAPRFAPMTEAARRVAPRAPAAGARSSSAGPTWLRAGEKARPARPLTFDEMLAEARLPLLARLPKGGERGWMERKLAITSVFQNQGLPVDSYERPQSAFAAAIASVLTQLSRRPVAEGNRKILVVSLAPGAGASMVALNLALASAQSRGTPLLIDLGRGGRTLTDRLAPEITQGLDEVYDGSVGFIRAALQDEATGLFFLPRESGRMLAAEEVDTHRLDRRFLPAIRRFSPVVMDGAAVGADPLLKALAERADDILLVARAEDVTLEAVAQARNHLGQGMGRLRGLILNEG